MPINPPVRAREFQVLDPCLLGRPVHLLPAFANRLAETLGAAIASPAGRRYWGAWRLAGLSFERAPDERGLRWLGVNGPYGMAAVAFERALLLGLLEGRYARNTPAAVGRDPGAERVTATEERLAATLAQQLAGLLDLRVAEGLAPALDAPPWSRPARRARPSGCCGWCCARRMVRRLPCPRLRLLLRTATRRPMLLRHPLRLPLPLPLPRTARSGSRSTTP